MSSVSPTNQDLSNDTTFSQIKSRVPVHLKMLIGGEQEELDAKRYLEEVTIQ